MEIDEKGVLEAGRAEGHTSKRVPEHLCTHITEAFVYDQYRKCTGPFKLRHLYKYLYYMLVQPAYCAIVLFRVQQFTYAKSQKYQEKDRGILRKVSFRLFDLAEKTIARLNFTLNAGFEASHLADIKPGLFIHHPQSIVIGGNTKIGTNCHLFKNILFGVKNGGYPRVKDNVTLFANATVLGPITINSNSVVAPNSVVIHDVEESEIVAGIPAKPIGLNEHAFVQKEGIPVWCQNKSME